MPIKRQTSRTGTEPSRRRARQHLVLGIYASDASYYYYDVQGRLIVLQSTPEVNTYQYADHQVTQTHNFSTPFDAAGRVTKETVTESISNRVWAVLLFEY